MATSIASVAGAVVATVASSGVVSAETTLNVARPIEPDSVKSGPVSIELDPTFYMKYKVNGDMGPNGTGYEDYMRPIRVAGEVVYCVEPHVVLNGNETVTRAIPLSQGVTLRKPGGTFQVSGDRLIRVGFVNWFMFNATEAQINQVVKTANALHSGDGDKMRNIRNGIRSHYNNDPNKFVFLMQLYHWWGASNGAVNVTSAPGSSPAMVDYWNESMYNKVHINGSSDIAVNWMVELATLYGRNMSAATYNNDGYILEVSGDGQRLFSGASFTPKDTPVTPPVNPPAESDLPMSLSMQKKSTLSADEIAKSNGEYSLKDAQYGLFAPADVSQGWATGTGDFVKQGALPKYTLITDDNGYAKLNYIESGVWYLKELKAPQGHQLDTNVYKLTVKRGQPEVHWSGEYRVPVAYTTDKPIEKVTQPTPEIGTTFKDDKGSKEVDAKLITLVDTVSYKNLKPGTEYTVSGRLMDKETGKELSPAVTATTKFTPTATEGTVDIKFTLDASKLGGKKVVAFEKVSEGATEVAAHEDINDEGQTVTVKKPVPNPSIGTTLKDDQGAKEVEPKQVTLIDTVKYTNLIVGKEYEVSGRLMDKETGKELSPAVTATTKFTATQSNGSIDIKFTLDASRLAGKRIVAFEKVSQGGKVVASHEDINDEDQTVKVKSPNPSIGTTLKDDKGAKEVEPKQITLVDTVKYTNLIVGKEYEVSGRLMDKETGKELEPAVTATTKFTATQSNGSIDIKFTLDASKLAGKKVVAFEKVSESGKVVASHEDINDEGQTVVVKSPNPSIGTTLKDDKGAKEVEPKQVTLIDTVKYTNLIVGKEYEVSGRLMDKETGKELSPAVTATTKFTATQPSGSIDIKFTLDASRLAGKRVVAFEKVSQGGKLVAAHEDINDEDQTVKVKSPNPEIGTTLKDDKGAKEVEPKQVTLIDTVKYTNLTVGKEYEVTGRLMDKETGKELSPVVTATTKFKATQSNGSIDIKFTLDASKLAGKKVVAFEKVSEGGKLVAAHEDINDEGQTVVVKSPNPSIGTTLKDDQGAKEVEPKQVTLIDTVKYTNLIVGKEYEVSGRLMDKETGKELEPAVTATTKFTAKQSNGSIDIKFTLDASKLAGKRVVAFEKVSEGGKLVAAHEDINDEDQTVKVKLPNPSIGTTLTDDKGAKEVEPVQVTLVDKVAYTHLTVGKEYTVTGRLMDKETGKELEPAVTGSTKFTPTAPSGTADVTFTLDASKLAGKKVVAFEKVSEGEKEVAVHEDINDEGQTIVVKMPNPSIGTTLKDEQGAKEVEPKQVTLIDTVKYTNLIVGKEYEVTGRLMDKETGKELEPAVTGSTKFTPTEPSGTVDVKFTFDASKLAGKRVVAFEKVSDGEKEVAVHEDINDEDQTVTIKKLNPEIGTTLINKATGDHKASPDKEVTLVDTVKYKNLEVGKEYEVTGRLMDKATGKEFQPAVKATAKFKPTASEGSVDVTFTFDASALAGRSVVAFEVVTLDGQVVATHEDINDAGQTVEFTTPETPKPSEPKPKETPKTKVTPKTGVKGMNYGLVALIGAVVAALGLTSFAIYRKSAKSSKDN